MTEHGEEIHQRRTRFDVRDIGIPLGVLLSCIIAVAVGVLQITDRIDESGDEVKSSVSEDIRRLDGNVSALQSQLLQSLQLFVGRDELGELKTKLDQVYEEQVEQRSRLRRLEDSQQ